MQRTINRLGVKLKNSITKHGMWEGYTFDQMHDKVNDESEEFIQAIEKNDLHGPHGVASELLDLAVTCIKMSHQITKRKV